MDWQVRAVISANWDWIWVSPWFSEVDSGKIWSKYWLEMIKSCRRSVQKSSTKTFRVRAKWSATWRDMLPSKWQACWHEVRCCRAHSVWPDKAPCLLLNSPAFRLDQGSFRHPNRPIAGCHDALLRPQPISNGGPTNLNASWVVFENSQELSWAERHDLQRSATRHGLRSIHNNLKTYL